MIRGYTTVLSTIAKIGLIIVLLVAAGLDARAGQLTAMNNPASADKQERNVSVEFKDVTLADALHTLARKVNVGISYNTKTVPDKQVTYRADNRSIYKVLDAILAGTGLYATLSKNRKVILIKEQPVLPAVQQEVITGTVTDANSGATLPGVNILIKGTSTGTSTDANGKFELTVESLQDTLVVSYIGYGKQEVPIADRTTVNISLNPTAVGLDEVVVTGTGGGARKRELGTSVSEINAEDIQSEPVSNIEELLRGSKSGVQSLAVSGQVGGGGTLKLRGTTSISQGNYPLIFVNGVRLSTNRVPPPTLEDGRGPSVSSNPINFINPEDVSRMEIIKGAAATTLYGSEASSGVIQIFTQEGESEETTGSFSVSGGANFWPAYSDAINSHPTNLDLERIKKTGFSNKYNASVRGGTESLNYFLSGSFSNQDGIVDTQNSESWTVTGNFSFDLLDNLQISTNTTYGRQNTRYVPDSNNRHGYVLNTMRLDKGYKPGSRDVSWVLETELRGIVDNFITGANMEHTITFSETSSFESNVRVGFNQLEVYNRGVLPFGYELRPEGTIGTQRWRTRVLTAEYIGNWENQISSKIYSTLSFGAQLFNESLLDVKGGGIGFSGPGQQTLNSAARTSGTEEQIQKINAGFFIQEKINFNELVYVIGGLRIDGNSTFGESYGFEYYPKLSVSYVLSDSDFWNFNWWNTFRLRGALGYAGKAPGAFDAVRTYSPVSGLDGQPAVTANNVGNPDLGPERTREVEVGFDADLFNSRVNLNFTFFNDLTTDALIPVLPVPSTGFSNTQLRNVGEISSKGVEFSSNFIPVRTSSFQWSLGLELTKIVENINDMGGSAFINLGYEQGFKEGFAPPSFFGRKVTNPNEFADPVFEEDVFLGKVFPDLTFIFSTGIDIGRSFSIDARGELSKGGHVTNATAFLNTVRGYWPPTQGLQEQRDSEGIESLTAAERAKLSPFYGYDQFIESSDFFKLRSLSLNYNLPSSWTPSGVNSIKLSLLGSNLFKISDYSGLDPESMDTRVGSYSQRLDYYTLPPRRSVQMKLHVTL